MVNQRLARSLLHHESTGAHANVANVVDLAVKTAAVAETFVAA